MILLTNLLKDNKAIMKCWDYEKNKTINLDTLTIGSSRKAWWICDKNHKYEQVIQRKVKGSQCPYCTNQKVLKGYNDLVTINPKLAREWNNEKNGNLVPEEVIAGSNKKVWWKCSKGHEWEASIYWRNKGMGCPYCSNKKVLKGYNDLATTNPKLAREWNYEKNGNLVPEEVGAGAGKKVWWKCSKGHEWEAIINDRNNGKGCPYCTNQKVLKGYNDLATTNPKLAKEWNYEKNGNLVPEEVGAGSEIKVWWKCSKGHEWEAMINSRNRGNGCPVCCNQLLVKGLNDLATTNPKLAKEWDYEKNKYGPDEVQEHANKKVWWKCSKGHEWFAEINSRSSGRNCPICSKELQTSFPEKVIYFYIKKCLNDAIENYKPSWLNNKEIDIFIPSKNIGIEYDGDYWHTDTSRDIEKDIICKKHNIKLIRVREPKCISLESSICIILKNKTVSELEKKVDYLINNILQLNTIIDLKKDKNKIYALLNYQSKDNSLYIKFPDLSDEWDYEKNNPLLPSQVKPGSDKKVWWKCKKCNYSWETRISHRTSGHGCPRCAFNIKAVEQYDKNLKYINTYNSITEAQKKCNVLHIKKVCEGKQKTAGGFIWKYKNSKD